MAKVGKKKGLKTVLVVLLSALTVAGGVAAATALIQPSETKEVGRLSWKVGGLVTTNGVEDEKAKTSIVMTKAVGARGLHVEVSEEAGFTGTYSVCYYTALGAKIDFAKDEAGSTNFSSSEDFANAYAVYAKVVYTPNLEEGKDRLYFWDVYNYTDDITVTYNRVQDGPAKNASFEPGIDVGNVYSIVGYNGDLYAVDGTGALFVSTNGGEYWALFGSQPFTSNVIVEELSIIDGKLYVPTRSGLVKTLDLSSNEATWEESNIIEGVNVSVNHVKQVNGITFALCNTARGIYAFDEDSNTWKTCLSGSSFEVRDICYVNGKYIAVCDRGDDVNKTNILISDNPFESWSSALSDLELGDFRRIMHDGTHYILSGSDKDDAPVIYIGDDMANLHKATINSAITRGQVRDVESFDGKLFATIYSAADPNGEFLMSEDNGASWKVILDGVDDLWTLYNAGNRLFIGGHNAIYYFEK